MTDPAQLVANLGGHVRRLITHPADELSLLHRTVSFWLRLSLSCAAKLRRDKAWQVAAALSYQTLFSLIPMLVLGLLVFGSMRGLDPAAEQLRITVVDFFLPESLVSPEAAPVADGTTTGDEFNEARELLRARVDDLLERVSQVSFAGVGVVGLLVFLYGATTLMSTIEASFNAIYQAEETRPLAVRVPLYVTVVVLSPLALVTAQVARDRLLAPIEAGAEGGRLAGLLAFLAPLGAAWLVAFLLFRLVPNTPVRWRCAAIGGLVAALAWILFKSLFGLYLRHTVMTTLYGALALVPLFLLWIYGSWLLALFGLELSYSLQYLSIGPVTIRPPFPGDPRWFLPIMRNVARAFIRGETVGVTELSRRCQLPPAFLRPYLRVLERADLVRRARHRGGDRVVLLARPAEAIPVREILSLEGPPQIDGGDELLARLEQNRLDSVGDLTLAELLSQTERASSEDR